MLLFVLTGPASPRAQGESSNGEAKNEPFVNKIVIHGNEYFSDDELKKQMTTKESGFFSIFKKPRLREDFLRRDIAALSAFYHANGFLEASVELGEIRHIEGGNFVDVVISVVENEAIRVKEVVFRHPGVIERKKLREDLILEAGDPFNPSMVEADIYTIKRHYFDEGYLGVVVDDSAGVDGKQVSIRYDITPGPQIRIRNIEITGNSLTKNSIIEKELTLKVGEIFKLGDAVETQRNLFETGLFTEADVIPEALDMDAREVDLTVRVRERKSAYVEVGFGVGNIVGSRITGEWGDRNLLGTGRLLRYRAEYSFGIFDGGDRDFVKYYRHEIEAGQRRILGTKIQLRLNAFLEKDATVEDIVIHTVGAALGGTRHLTEFTDLYAELRPERIKREALGAPTERSTSIILGGALVNDLRDFVLDPRRGKYRDVRVQFAGGPLGGDNDFYTLSSSLQRYWNRKRSTVLAVRVRAGYADAFGDSRDSGVPIENRFFTGGGNSVRGFDENSLGPKEVVLDPATGVSKLSVVGGNVLLLTNVELRFPLPLLSRYNFSGSVFADGGNVWERLSSIDIRDFRLYADEDEIRQEDYRYSVGLGIRYNTPLGPIRFDYGLPIKKEIDISGSGRFHFSLGQMF